MEYQELKKRVKSIGERVTKDVGGKRIRLTSNELRKKLRRDMKNRVNNARETITMCRSIVNMRGPGPRPPPPPPPPPIHPTKGGKPNIRSQLVAELKANLKRRGISKN